MRTAASAPLSLEEPLLVRAPASRGPGSRERRTCAKPTPGALRSANHPQARDSSRPVLLNSDCAKLRNRLELYGRNVLASVAPQQKGEQGNAYQLNHLGLLRLESPCLYKSTKLWIYRYDPGIEPWSPALQADSLPTGLPRKTRSKVCSNLVGSNHITNIYSIK